MRNYNEQHHPNHLTLFFSRHAQNGSLKIISMQILLDKRAIQYVFIERPVDAGASPEERALDLIEKAITKWIKESPEGAIHWAASNKNLNMDYILKNKIHENGSLNAFLQHKGIEIMSIQGLSSLKRFHIDRNLADPT